LFFGDRHRAENFYYRDDLEDMVRDGLLNRLDLAFSRDQAQRVYVQHRMTDYGAANSSRRNAMCATCTERGDR
jgi:sulfite reductase (NADPH) flavoprotein alpha-component